MPGSFWIAVLAVAIVAAAMWYLSIRHVQRNVSLPEEKNPADIES